MLPRNQRKGLVNLSNGIQSKHLYKWFIGYLIAFACISILVQSHMMMGLDSYFQRMFRYTPHYTRHMFTQMDKVFSPINDFYFACILSAILLSASVYNHHFVKGLRATVLLAGSTSIAAVANMIFKPIFGRIRPDNSSGFSYPSAHAMLAFSFFVPLFYLLSRNISSRAGRYSVEILGFMPVLFIGFSRVYLEKHYITDIAGGYLLSAAIFCGLLLLNQRLALLKKV